MHNRHEYNIAKLGINARVTDRIVSYGKTAGLAICTWTPLYIGNVILCVHTAYCQIVDLQTVILFVVLRRTWRERARRDRKHTCLNTCSRK